MILSISTGLIILAILIYTAFLLYKQNYLKYNSLKLDPLEEKKIDSRLLLSNHNFKIWLVGDSRIAQWNTEFLLSTTCDTDTNIVNLGIHGQTSQQILQRLKNHLQYGNPNWVVLELGINDLKIIGLNKKESDQISKNCYDNIIAIIELCRQKNINVICISVFPNGKPGIVRSLVWNKVIDNEIIKINKKLRRYCENNNVEYFDAFKLLAEKNQVVKKKFQKNFLHLNNQAYLFLSEKLILEFGKKLHLISK